MRYVLIYKIKTVSLSQPQVRQNINPTSYVLREQTRGYPSSPIICIFLRRFAARSDDKSGEKKPYDWSNWISHFYCVGLF